MRTLPFFLFLLIAHLPQPTRGQSLSRSDSTEAADWLSRSRAAWAKDRPDSAEIFEKKAIAIFQKKDALTAWFEAQTERATVIADQLGRPLDAVNFIKNNEKTGWREPKTHPEWKAKIRFNNFGDYFAEAYLGDFQLGRTFLEASFADFNTHLGPAEKETAYYIYGQLGNICTRLGDYERAQILLKQKADLALQNRDLAIAAEGLHDLAIARCETGQIDSAIALQRRALALPDGEKPMRVSYLGGLAGYFLLKKDLAAAESTCRDARAVYKNWPREKREWAAFSLAEIAETEAQICLARRQFAAAKAKYAQSLRHAMADYGSENRREVAKIRIQLGEIELLEGHPAAALAFFQAALQNVIPGFLEKSPSKNPLPGLFYPENTIREALDGKARAWQLEGKSEKSKGKSAVTAALQNALDCHLLLEEIEQKLRETYQFESSSLQSLDEGRGRLERATEIAHALFLETGDPKFAHQAFLFCEKSKGLLLLQGIARARSDFKLPADLRFREQAVNSRVALLEKTILENKAAEGKKAGNLRRLEDELLQAKQVRQKFWDELKTSAPDYWKISQAPNWATATSLQNLLEPDQDLVEYLVGEGQLYVFRASKGRRFSMRKTALPPDFLMKIEWLRDFLGKYDPSPVAQMQFIETSNSLFKLLLGPEMADPLFSKNTRLLVVPDGVLGFVPFEVLLENLPQGFAPSLAQNPSAIHWASLGFLLKKKAISYAWSASLLREQLKKMPLAGLKNLAAFVPDYAAENDDGGGPITANDRGSDGNLPGAKAETDAIEKLVGGKFFRGGAATRGNFLHWAGQFRILHLAMHAVSDADDPAMSRLIFTTEKGMPNRANRLYINDLQQISLRADLAVLSACNTGSGRLHRGEGVYSLARGFALAGVSATLMSLWRLSDDSTPELMSVFYQKIKDGQRKDDALRSAKLDWLTGGGAPLFKHPYFWAGMVANGNMRPVNVSAGGRIFGWMVALGLAAALLIWFSVKYNFFLKLKSIFAAAKN